MLNKKREAKSRVDSKSNINLKPLYYEIIHYCVGSYIFISLSGWFWEIRYEKRIPPTYRRRSGLPREEVGGDEYVENREIASISLQ